MQHLHLAIRPSLPLDKQLRRKAQHQKIHRLFNFTFRSVELDYRYFSTIHLGSCQR